MVRKGGGENKEGGGPAEAVIKTGMLITLCISEKPVVAGERAGGRLGPRNAGAEEISRARPLFRRAR